MINSPKSIILCSKQFNTQSSVTPKKKGNASNLHHSIQKSMSFENSNGGVSYAQLQIILENIHKIKKKGSQQIHYLQNKCGKQQQQLKNLREQVKRYQNLQQTIKQQRQNIQHKFAAQIIMLRQDLQLKQQSNKQLAKTFNQLKKQYEEKQWKICELNQKLSVCDRQIQIWQNKYKAVTQVLQVNETSNQVKLIRQQYTDIPHLLSLLNSTLSDLRHQKQNIQQYKQNIEEYKIQVSKSNKIIQTITEQNRHLLSVIEELNKQKQSLVTDLASSQNQKTSMIKQRDNTMNQIEDQIETIKKSNCEQIKKRQSTIQSLRSQIKSLQNKLISAADRERQIKQQSEFKSIVDEVCDEYADYQNVMKRIQYLEKYRSQYYFNLQKIQYLCRILDS